MEKVVAIKFRGDLLFYVVLRHDGEPVELLGLEELRAFIHADEANKSQKNLAEFYNMVREYFENMQSVSVETNDNEALNSVIIGCIDGDCASQRFDNYADAIVFMKSGFGYR